MNDQRAAFQVGDAQKLPIADGSFDATLAGLVINFIPDQAKAVHEMKRATRPGGTVAAYVWDYAGEMQMMRRFWDEAVALDANAVSLDEGRRFPVCRPEPLASLFQDAGLGGVEVRSIDDRYSRTLMAIGHVSRRPGAGARLLHVSFRRPSCRIARPDTREPSDK